MPSIETQAAPAASAAATSLRRSSPFARLGVELYFGYLSRFLLTILQECRTRHRFTAVPGPVVLVYVNSEQ